MSVEFDRGSPGKFDSRTLNRKTLNRWTGRMWKGSGIGWRYVVYRHLSDTASFVSCIVCLCRGSSSFATLFGTFARRQVTPTDTAARPCCHHARHVCEHSCVQSCDACTCACARICNAWVIIHSLSVTWQSYHANTESTVLSNCPRHCSCVYLDAGHAAGYSLQGGAVGGGCSGWG